MCPQIALPPQRPDLYVRIHHRAVAAVLSVLPADVVCSMDELADVLGERDRSEEIAARIKRRLRREELLARRLTLSADCLDSPSWASSTLFVRANDDLT